MFHFCQDNVIPLKDYLSVIFYGQTEYILRHGTVTSLASEDRNNIDQSIRSIKELKIFLRKLCKLFYILHLKLFYSSSLF